jgi:eukaryotic-like serine/threonine-protein kinase
VKLNCWEYKRCRREPGGARADELGACPAATDMTYDRVNGGRAAGRYCWAVAGTFCGGKVQGDQAQKMESCSQCDIYQTILHEEGAAAALCTGTSPQGQLQPVKAA